MDFIMAPLIVGIITLGIYKLFELFVCRKERLTMIEKIGSTIDASMVQDKFAFSEKNQPVFGTLKIACLLLGIGRTGTFVRIHYFTIFRDERIVEY